MLVFTEGRQQVQAAGGTSQTVPLFGEHRGVASVPLCLEKVENLTMLVATEGLQEVQEEEGTSQVRSSPSRASDASNPGAAVALPSCTTSRRCPAFCCIERSIGLYIGEELPKEEILEDKIP